MNCEHMYQPKHLCFFFFLQCMESDHYRVIPLSLAYLAARLNKMDELMLLCCHQGSLVAQMVKNLPAVQEIWVWSLGWKDPLEKGMGTHSSILSWRVPWTEEPGELRPVGSQRIGHNWATNTHNAFIVCPVFRSQSDISHYTWGEEKLDLERKLTFLQQAAVSSKELWNLVWFILVQFVYILCNNFPQIESTLGLEFKRDFSNLFLTPFKNTTNNISQSMILYFGLQP